MLFKKLFRMLVVGGAVVGAQASCATGSAAKTSSDGTSATREGSTEGSGDGGMTSSEQPRTESSGGGGVMGW